MFAVIVDGTRDICGSEQESICIRYVSHDLFPHELFLGFYETPETTGARIAALIKDALLRLQLPLACLRGQTYDGAANMAGVYNGAQALVRQEQPLALFVHCISHCVNLATEAAMTESSVIRDAVCLVNEVGVLSSQSGKFQTIFSRAASSMYDTFVRLRPLCPTRWTVRAKAIKHVLQQYESVLQGLEEMSKSNGESAVRAAGMLQKFMQGNTYLALVCAADVIELLETLTSVCSHDKKL